MDTDIREVVDSIGSAVRSDGGDLALVSVHNRVAEVQYVIYPGACEECLMSKDQLELLLKAAFEAQATGVEDVKIILADKRA